MRLKYLLLPLGLPHGQLLAVALLLVKRVDQGLGALAIVALV